MENEKYTNRVMKFAQMFDDLEKANEYDAAQITVDAQAEAIIHILREEVGLSLIHITHILYREGYIKNVPEKEY